MSAHLAIQTALVALLTASPGLASGNVKTNATRPMAAQHTAQVNVRMLQSRADYPRTLGAGYEWQTSFAVDCLARGASSASEPAATVDALLEAAWARIAVWQPTATLGVIDVRMTPTIDWQTDDGDTPLVAATISLVVQHRTRSNSLVAWP
jgi:hypothetical protein